MAFDMNAEWKRHQEARAQAKAERRAIFPGYVFKGRTYATVNGLSRALLKDCGATSHSMVKDRVITAYGSSANGRPVVATYSVSAPQVGVPLYVSRVAAT